MSSIVLAEEILDLLVDILGSEYTLTSPSSLPLGPKELGTVRALGSLSLASRRLASRCRVHRFWKLTFHADTWPGLTAPPPYREDAIQRTVTLFRDNPRLFWYVRDIDVVFRREGGDPFHFLQSLHSFLPNVHNVDTMALRVPGSPRRWSEFDKLTQAALLQCINQNPLARMLRVDGIRLPENILKILPSSLGGLRLHGSGGIDAPISQCPILAPETKCRPEELQISISDPFTRIMMEQEPSFFSRLARLDVFIHGDSVNLPTFHRLLCDPHLLVTTNVHTLDLSYHGSDDAVGFQELLLGETRFRLMPSVTDLTVSVSLLRRSGEQVCPSLASRIILAHLVPAFASIQFLGIQISWSVLQGVEGNHDAKMIDGDRDGFKEADYILSEGKILPELNHVAIEVNFSDHGLSDEAGPRVDIAGGGGREFQGRLLEEIRIVFQETSRNIKQFTINGILQ